MKTQTLANAASGIAIVSALFLTGLVTYWANHNYKWIKYYNTPFPIITKEVKPGEVLIYDVEYCRFNDRQATFSKDIISVDGSVGITLPSYESSFGQNCNGAETPDVVRVASTIIPEQLPPGLYIMKMTVEQQQNPIRTDSFSVQTEPFEIVR